MGTVLERLLGSPLPLSFTRGFGASVSEPELDPDSLLLSSSSLSSNGRREAQRNDVVGEIDVVGEMRGW